MDHVVDPLVTKIAETVKKKNKGGMELRPHQIKSHLWIFVNCLIENPAFDSQTKENMTLKQSAFGSKCEFSDKFVKEVSVYYRTCLVNILDKLLGRTYVRTCTLLGP